jgi:hypothetical protein
MVEYEVVLTRPNASPQETPAALGAGVAARPADWAAGDCALGLFAARAAC